MAYEYLEMLNKKYGTTFTGFSQFFGSTYIPKNANRLVVKDFGNGLGRVLYFDNHNRLIAERMEMVR